MFERFGEFGSAAEINELAVNLRREGDVKSLEVLAKENGIDPDIVEVFVEGDILYLCDDMAAAIGKIEVEAKDMKLAEIMEDWVEYLKIRCMESEEVAKAVRKKGKRLEDAIADILRWSFAHQTPINDKIKKAAGVTAGRVTLGIPGMGTAKRILQDYYLGK